MKEINENRMQEEVGKLFSNHKHHFTNKYIFNFDWESDFFSVTSSGYCCEVEVKISKSDFKADFKKFKHVLFEGRKGIEVIKEAKYKKRKRGLIRIAPERKVNPQNELIPNKFFFACPEGLISLDEVPDYAGLIYVDGNVSRVVKQAPFIHKRKFDIKDLLFSKYQWGYINSVEKLDKVEKKYKSTSSRLDVMCRGLEKEFKLKSGSVTSFSAFKKLLNETK